MAQFANMFEVDLNNRSYPVSLVQTVSEGNVYSNRIGAYVYADGAPVNLGGACTGLVMRADGTTVPLTGYVEGNAAYVVLDQPSCAIPGPIQVAVNNVVGENITTLLVAYGTVILTDTRNYVEPGTPIPDITELLAEIDNMREATAAAEAAATKAVRYDTTQSLTDAQKETARANIGVASDTNVSDLRAGFIEDNEFFQRNVSFSGNQLPFYVARFEDVYVNDLNGVLVLSPLANRVTYIIPVEQNTQYIWTYGSEVAFLAADRKTIVGIRKRNIYSENSGASYYCAISFDKTTYPESTYKFNIRQTGDQDVRNEPSAIEIDKLCLTSSQQKYLTVNIYQDGWELGDIRTSDGQSTSSNTTLRTKNFCRVFPSETYMITVDSIEHGQNVGFLYQYSKSLAYAGSVSVINVKNGIPFTLASVAGYVKIVLTSAYGTTFNNDLIFYQPGGMVRDISELLRARMPQNSKIIIVSKYGDGDYTSLRHAVINANDGDVIFVRRGVYENEEVEAWAKNITIIGESPYNTIIQNETDAYATPPLEMSVGAIYNLCFHAIAHESAKKAYALHIDNDNQQDGTFYAENCIFISDDGPAAVGAGSRINHKQVYKNCIFENTENQPAFFGNEATNQQTAGVVNNQYYQFYNCTFKTPNKHDNVVIMRGMKAEGNTVWCTFVDCAFMDDGTTEHPEFRMDYTSPQYIGTATEMGDMGLINWNLDSISFGNTIPALNRCKEGQIVYYGPIGT